MAEQPPEMPPMPSMMPMLVVMIMMLGMYWIDGSEHVIGKLLDYVLGFLDFNYEMPVVTLMLVGIIMTLLNTILRSFTMDVIGQTKNQQIMSAFNKELRQARIENNTYKIKKLTELQPTMMAKNMETSTVQMKMMPYTMIIVIPMFLWVRYFVAELDAIGLATIMVPWSSVGLLTTVWFVPAWILIYTLISIPFGQVLGRAIRGYQFSKRLKDLENEIPIEVDEAA